MKFPGVYKFVYRDHARTQKYLKASRLRYNALPEEIICNPERGITREQVLSTHIKRLIWIPTDAVTSAGS